MGPVLYILMRTDLNSLNPGKAMAQAAHVGSAFEAHFKMIMQMNSLDEAEKEQTSLLNSAYQRWKCQTRQGFGTTIVLGGSMNQIKNDVKWLESKGFLTSVIHDPTYPIADGTETHLIPLDTCAYVFAPSKDDVILQTALNNYNLHP